MKKRPVYVPVALPPAAVRARSLTGWPRASFLFVLSICVNLLTAAACLWYPPQSRSHAAGVRIPTSATCLRVTRHADYTTVDSMVGAPAVETPLLLRLDQVVERDSSESTTRLFAQDAVKSTSVTCAPDGRCVDVFLVSDGGRNRLRRVYANFTYRHYAAESHQATTASRIESVGGEMRMRRGFAYWLTATHLCHDDASSEHSAPRRSYVHIDSSGKVQATQASMRSNPVLGQSPVGTASASECTRSANVSLFPVAAAVETSWLSITDTSLYNAEPDAVNDRRHIAEVGTTCAENISGLSRSLVLYRLDCTAYNSCVDGASLPFRRVASSSVFIDLRNAGAEWMAVQLDHTLDGLPKLADSDAAFYASLLKMTMITLAASVVYVRSKRATASSSWLVRNCISISKDCGSIASSSEGHATNSMEDRVVGFTAFVARGIVAASRFDRLSYDGQTRVCVFELSATLLSAAHWALRYTRVGLKPDSDEPPVSKCGGSTAIVDSTAAVMMAFSEPPTTTAADGQFDPTARMLVSLLISTIVLSRCAFSAACCASLWPKLLRLHTHTAYAWVLRYSALAWCFQSAALAVNMCDLFVSPASYSMSRSLEGNPLAFRTTVFFAVVCAGLPLLTATCRHILSDKEHVD